MYPVSVMMKIYWVIGDERTPLRNHLSLSHLVTGALAGPGTVRELRATRCPMYRGAPSPRTPRADVEERRGRRRQW